MFPAGRRLHLLTHRIQAGSGTWQTNNIVYEPPRLPALLNIINGGFWDANYTKLEHTFILKADEVVELLIHGAAHGIIHPFHLQCVCSGPVNYKNPPPRDMVAVSDGDVLIRFRADNPGPWFLHCHIDWHLEAGLAVVFAEAPNSFANKDDPKSGIASQQYLDLCPPPCINQRLETPHLLQRVFNLPPLYWFYRVHRFNGSLSLC
ncbi:Cupredoxin [Mycena crocata]|nr:Cupredoxin [Mycena crocata]